MLGYVTYIAFSNKTRKSGISASRSHILFHRYRKFMLTHVNFTGSESRFILKIRNRILNRGPDLLKPSGDYE